MVKNKEEDLDVDIASMKGQQRALQNQLVAMNDAIRTKRKDIENLTTKANELTEKVGSLSIDKNKLELALINKNKEFQARVRVKENEIQENLAKIEKLEASLREKKLELSQKLGVANDSIEKNKSLNERLSKQATEQTALAEVLRNKETENQALSIQLRVRQEALDTKEQDYIARKNGLQHDIANMAKERDSIALLKQDAYNLKASATQLLEQAENKMEETLAKESNALREVSKANQIIQEADRKILELQQQQRKTKGGIGSLNEAMLEVNAKKAEVNKIIRQNRLQKEIDEYKIT